MLRIDWSDRPALKLGIIAAFILSIGSIWWAIDYGRSQEAAYEEGARKGYTERAKHGCYDVANSKPAAVIKQADAKPCTKSEKGVEENDNRRDYADLVAQRSSALWAKIMGIAAVIGVALSLLGIVLVAITFNETRKSNEIARESMQRQLRAYVGIDEFVWAIDHGDFRPSIRWKNTGQTPASNANAYVNFTFSEFRLPENHIFNPPEKKEESWPTSICINGFISISHPEELTTDTIIRSAEGDCYIYLWGRVDYMDVFNEHHYCEVAAEMVNSFLPGGKLKIDWHTCATHNIST